MTREELHLLMCQHGIGVGYAVDCDTYELKMVNPPMLYETGKKSDSWRGKLCYEFIYGANKPCSFCKMDQTNTKDTIRWYHESPLNGSEMLVRNYRTVL